MPTPPILPPKTGIIEEQPNPHYRTVDSNVWVEKSGSKVRDVKVARIKMKSLMQTRKKKVNKLGRIMALAAQETLEETETSQEAAPPAQS